MHSFLRVTLLYLILLIATQSIVNTNAIGIRKRQRKWGKVKKVFHAAKLKKNELVRKFKGVVKDKLDLFQYSKLEWTEPKQGEQFMICSSGGGARALVAFWAVMKRHGKRIFQQASMVATNSGSSWFVNQLLYSKEDFFDSKTGGGA